MGNAIRKSSLTPFGMKCREYRMRSQRSLGEQATYLRVSPSDLSEIETGARPVPQGLPESIGQWLELPPLDVTLLVRLSTADSNVVYLDERHRKSRKLFRKINRLSPAQIRQLRQSNFQEAVDDG
jgi:transcriptional regulator with XRE-family HTH domain